jgi:hypothetical protein
VRSSPFADTTAQALCWRSASELARLRTGLQAALDRWAHDWGVASATVRLDNAWEAQPLDSASWRPLAAGADGNTMAWIAWGEPAADLEQLLYGGVPASAPASPTLSRALADDALSFLRRSFVHWLGALPSDAPVDDGPPERDARPWSGAVRAELVLQTDRHSVRFQAHIGSRAWPAAAAGARAGKAVPALPALNPLPDALVAQPLRFQARLADVQVTLGELIGLCAGDVLITGQRLADPLSVSSPESDGTAVFGARLVQRDGWMAVALTKPS